MRVLHVSIGLLLSCAATFAALPAQDAPKPAAPEKNEAAAKKDEVELKPELATLEQVFKRRAALHWLKASKETVDALAKVIDPASAAGIQALLANQVRYDELDYHFVEKARNCEQRILNQLRGEKFRGDCRVRTGGFAK